jgi:pectate lyase
MRFPRLVRGRSEGDDMRKTTLAGAAGIALVAALLAAPALAGSAAKPSAAALALGRQVLPANDGWAAAGTGTTGGSTAAAANIYLVRTRAELVAAVTGATPKIVFVDGGIDGNVDDNDQPLTCADYAAPGYSLAAFLAAYDPAVWGRTSKPSGPLEDARVASTKNQGARVNVTIGANTTVIGLRGSKLTGINLLVNKVSNVIIRNLTMEDAHDCFPSWDPTDGATGNWNSLYDTLSVIGGSNVWVDHDTFSDGQNPDTDQPVYFGRPYQVHDGSLDITKAADLVTVESSRFYDHDKTMLIGSSDNAPADVGKLRVTLHHNEWQNVGQRAPRVRYGQVDVYDNYYVGTDESFYQYSWGVGVQSAIYAENNFVLLSADVPQSAVVHYWSGTAMTEIGSMVRYGTAPAQPTSFLAAYNAAYDPDIAPDAGWTPTLRAGPLTPTASVQSVVGASAGVGHLGV